MVIQTTRFGGIQIDSEDILNFAEGILGFDNLRNFVLIDDPAEEIFAWLQSCEVPEVAFPVLEPELFADNYQITLSKRELDSLSLESVEKARLFCIVTIPNDPTQMTANMKAPIVINPSRRLARQTVLQDHVLNIREPIFVRLQQRVVATPSTSIRTQALDAGVAVSIEKNSKPLPDAAL